MSRQQRDLAGMLVMIVVGLCLSSPAFAQPASKTFTGMRLEDALGVLQAQGLRLVYSTELVRPDMRVRTEPRAKTARQQLAELLQPHGLAAEQGPRGILQIVRKRTMLSERPSGPAASLTRTATARSDDADAPPSTVSYRERVMVTANRDQHAAIASEHRRVDALELGGLSGSIADDPVRVVQTLPGAAAGNDFRSDFSVRGSQLRHAGMVIDGVQAPWLQHAAPGRNDTGTLTMLGGAIVEEAVLLVGAYPRVDGGQIGPQLSLTLREGSRTARRFNVGVSGTSTTLSAEGPIGSAARGSWLVGARRSHVEWPMSRTDEEATVFGFSDVQSKIVYDVRPDQQIAFSLVAGMSNIEREMPNPSMVGDGLNRAGMATVAWRSVIDARTVIAQRVSLLTHDFHHRAQQAELASRGTDDAMAYRADVAHPWLGGVVEGGGQFRRLNGSRQGLTDLGATWLERSGHGLFRRTIGSRARFAAGLRFADSTLARDAAFDRWLRVEWSVSSRWHVHGSGGVTHQLPGLEEAAAWTEPASLRPEKATSIDVGVSRDLSTSVRWDATVFARREREVLRAPDTHPRLIDAAGEAGIAATRFENVLAGSVNGIEFTLTGRGQSGLSGWIAYSYGVARSTDVVRHETFPSDFDQRQAISLSGSTKLPGKTRLGLTFRAGTNFPVPGYLVSREGRLFIGSRRNQQRLPAYARLDLRAERSFTRAGHAVTVFAEALNVFNRVNYGPAVGLVLDTGEAVGFSERLFPRLLTAGLRVEF
jgi:hypothetical protein